MVPSLPNSLPTRPLTWGEKYVTEMVLPPIDLDSVMACAEAMPAAATRAAAQVKKTFICESLSFGQDTSAPSGFDQDFAEVFTVFEALVGRADFGERKHAIDHG